MTQISNDKLADIYIKMICRLNKEYIRGFFMWASIFHKNMDMAINKADDEVNTLWHECLEGKASLVRFIGAVKTYERLVLKGFGVYKNRNVNKK